MHLALEATDRKVRRDIRRAFPSLGEKNGARIIRLVYASGPPGEDMYTSIKTLIFSTYIKKKIPQKFGRMCVERFTD